MLKIRQLSHFSHATGCRSQNNEQTLRKCKLSSGYVYIYIKNRSYFVVRTAIKRRCHRDVETEKKEKIDKLNISVTR